MEQMVREIDCFAPEITSPTPTRQGQQLGWESGSGSLRYRESAAVKAFTAALAAPS